MAAFSTERCKNGLRLVALPESSFLYNEFNILGPPSETGERQRVRFFTAGRHDRWVNLDNPGASLVATPPPYSNEPWLLQQHIQRYIGQSLQDLEPILQPDWRPGVPPAIPVVARLNSADSGVPGAWNFLPKIHFSAPSDLGLLGIQRSIDAITPPDLAMALYPIWRFAMWVATHVPSPTYPGHGLILDIRPYQIGLVSAPAELARLGMTRPGFVIKALIEDPRAAEAFAEPERQTPLPRSFFQFAADYIRYCRNLVSHNSTR